MYLVIRNTESSNNGLSWGPHIRSPIFKAATYTFPKFEDALNGVIYHAQKNKKEITNPEIKELIQIMELIPAAPELRHIYEGQELTFGELLMFLAFQYLSNMADDAVTSLGIPLDDLLQVQSWLENKLEIEPLEGKWLFDDDNELVRTS